MIASFIQSFILVLALPQIKPLSLTFKILKYYLLSIKNIFQKLPCFFVFLIIKFFLENRKS